MRSQKPRGSLNCCVWRKETRGDMATCDADTETECESRSSISSSGSSDVHSILDSLRAPLASDFAQRRKLSAPPTGVKKGKGRASSAPVNVSPRERVKMYPGENFSVSTNNKTVFCLGCREEVSVKKSVLELHIKSKKHITGKEEITHKGKE